MRRTYTPRSAAPALAIALALAPTPALGETATGTTELTVVTGADTGGGATSRTMGQFRRTVTGPMPSTGDRAKGTCAVCVAVALAAGSLATAAATRRAPDDGVPRKRE